MLSDNGKNFSDFHSCCDNKGPTLILFHVSDGNKVGIYTPLTWDSFSQSKFDKETFLFNLNKNKKYKKINDKVSSIFCEKDHGPYCEGLGCGRSCQTMKKLVYYSYINNYFENSKEILSSNSKNNTNYYNLLEVEIFEIIK